MPNLEMYVKKNSYLESTQKGLIHNNPEQKLICIVLVKYFNIKDISIVGNSMKVRC